MADRKVTVAVEVQQTNKTTSSPAPGPAGEIGNRNVLPGSVGDLGRKLLSGISSGIGGPGIGGSTAAAFAGISQALRTGVVSGFQASKGILAGAVMVGAKAAGGLVTGAAGIGGPGIGGSTAAAFAGISQALRTGVVSGFQASKGIITGAFGKVSQAIADRGGISTIVSPSKSAQQAVGPQLQGGFRDIALGLGIATAAASGFTAAMSPMTFGTLTGSIQLLGNEFVKLLIPAFSMASLTIQNLTKWIDGLDAGIKNAISSTATWAAPTMVALGVLGAMAPILRLVTGGLILLTQALWTTGRALLAFVLTPAGATFTAIAVSVGILTNGFGLLGDSIERAGIRANETRERLARLSQPGAQLARSDYEALNPAIRRAIEATPAAQRNAFLSQTIGTTRMQLEQIQATDPARTATIIEDALTRLNRSGFLPGQAISQTTDSRRRELLVDVLAAQGVSRPEAQRQVGLVTEGQIAAGRTPEQLTAAARIIALVDREASARERLALLERTQQQGVPGIFQGLRQSTPMQAQSFASASDMWHNVVMDVASRGQLEQDILREIMRNTAAQVAIMQAQNGGVANPPPLPPGAFPPN